MEKHFLTLSFRGIFFSAYERDAIVLSHLMNYKLLEKDNGTLQCSFPESALGKVVAALTDAAISYRVYKPKNGDNLFCLGEKEFEDNEAYEKLAQSSAYDEAYLFLTDLCRRCKSIQDGTIRIPSGTKMVIDLGDELVYRKFQVLLDKLDSL